MSSYGCNGFILQRNTIKSPLFKKTYKTLFKYKVQCPHEDAQSQETKQ